MSAVPSAGPSVLDDSETFASLNLGLDRRLMKAVAKVGYVYPTLVQSKGIPLALQGKDLMVRAKTGSGKTAAYTLPILHKILANPSVESAVKAVVLVPTKELCDQTRDVIWEFSYYCRDTVQVLSLGGFNTAEQAARLKEIPDILVATPGRLATHLRANNLSIQNLQTLVVDEADLVLSFGYAEDIRYIVSQMPRICQSFLMSATLSPEVADLKRLVLNAPAVLKLEGGAREGTLSQFYVKVSQSDKLLLLYALLKLQLIGGKAILFVNDIDSCYKLKLFLDKFSINAAVLNAELPANSRAHILQEFNKGLFEYLICTDEALGEADDSDSDSDGEDGEEEEEGDEEAEAEESGSESGSGEESESGSGSGDSDGSSDSGAEEEEEDELKQRIKEAGQHEADEEKKARKAAKAARAARIARGEEFGVARGVDFQGVSTVVNVDFPRSVASYTHRIGRTARGGASGAALSFLTSLSEADAKVLAKIQETQLAREDGTPNPAELPFDQTEVDGFRYRVEDVVRSITKTAIKEARLQEIKQEMMNSGRLQAHFEDNPKDLVVLRHDSALQPHKVKRHLASVPSYLLPSTLQAAATAAGGGVQSSNNKKRRRQMNSDAPVSAPAKDVDPLKTFEYNARKKAQTGEADGPSVIALTLASKGRSSSGRKQWKMRHHRGQFSSKPRKARKANPFA